MNKRKGLYIVGVILITAVVLFGINKFSQKSSPLNVALEQANENRTELELVLDHYTKIDIDEEKLKAAQYLITNSSIHSSIRTELKNKSNEPVVFNPMAYPTVRATREAKDSVFKDAQINQHVLPDSQSLKSKYLIKHINFIIEVWRKSPWKENVDFDQFCKYILPYRVVDEPISPWVEILNKKYAHILDTLSDKSILNACKAVNAQLAKDIFFDDRWYLGGLGTQTVPEIIESGSGNCDDLTVYGASVMRSLGIPVAVDFDLHGRYNNGHSWCVVLDERGKSWSFGPGEQQPGEHQNTFEELRWRRLARVFRRNFAITSNQLHTEVEDVNTIPPFFRTSNTEDVTEEYVNTFDVEYKVPKLPTKKDFLYLCVYNNQTWRPIQMGTLKQNTAVFPNMGADIMYLVGYYHNNRIYPVSEPFILERDGTKTIIAGSSMKANKGFQIDKISGYEYVKKDKDYELFFWDTNKWKFVYERKPIKDSLIIVDSLNKNTLYRFQEISRPFTVGDTLTFW
ncbi:MAG: transglutaminase domain-containing protein [Bacteroidetes bacterium]|nr:transglutaminase domain-containing protein [Bacteroidota bacterium]